VSRCTTPNAGQRARSLNISPDQGSSPDRAGGGPRVDHAGGVGLSFSYQLSCGENWWQERHCVTCHWRLHAGHLPLVSKVFQQYPHEHDQRSCFPGTHPQTGQRMRFPDFFEARRISSSRAGSIGAGSPSRQTRTGSFEDIAVPTSHYLEETAPRILFAW